ncbi:hypothetical protein [Achromobacter anxifer]|uniref:hypothetical protein n=1 Tax=Achromobacter anxifer TaxID=1287737 RepID=UPI0023F6F23A|nr:hypothetical protein [Achromobacter anxifer]MDF8362384.1 hypothetical protein [Achromobacter anxifer]
MKRAIITIAILGLSGCGHLVTSGPSNLLADDAKQAQVESALTNPPVDGRYTAKNFGLEVSSATTVEEATKAYPDYGWNGRAENVRGSFLTEDEKQVYFNGRKNAERLAYMALLAGDQVRTLRDRHFGNKLLVVDVDDQTHATYTCYAAEPRKAGILPGLLMLNVPIDAAAKAQHERDVESDEAYWSCFAQATVRVLIGSPIQRYRGK